MQKLKVLGKQYKIYLLNLNKKYYKFNYIIKE